MVGHDRGKYGDRLVHVHHLDVHHDGSDLSVQASVQRQRLRKVSAQSQGLARDFQTVAVIKSGA